MQDTQKEWITIKQLQEILGIGHTKAYDLVATGEIPSVRFGRVIRINRRKLDQWLEDRAFSATVT